MPRVFISDKLDPNGVDRLRDAGLDVDFRPGLKGAELREAVQAADGLIVRSGTQVTAELLEHPGNLKAVVRAGVGVDNIDVAAATRRGIVVMNTPGGNTVSTAEHTVTLLMSLARNIPAAHSSLQHGRWDRSKLTGTQLAGKTIGVIGLGRIGREVARRAAGLDMKVLGFDPFLSTEKAAQLGIESVADLDELLPRCDFFTVHTPLTDETRDLIDAPQMERMKPTARIINCARGGIINEDALAEALQAGRIAGAALDVFVSEPPGDHPLLHAPNVLVTPHLGASTSEAQESVALEAAELMTDFLQTGLVQCAVNMAAVDRRELEEVRLYVDMARRLGLLLAQMSQGAISRAELNYRGDVAQRSTRLVTAAFATGLLEYRLDQQVNIVNAELLAKERGIELVEQSSSKTGDFATLIQADVCTDKDRFSAACTLFGNQYLRLVRLGPYHLDTYLDGIMLMFMHRDVPGLIGYIGTICGKHKVNIARMTVGRQKPGGEAVAILNLDNEPPQVVLEEMREHEQVSSVHVVKLPPAGEMPHWFG